jgi:hypothetical protein
MKTKLFTFSCFRFVARGVRQQPPTTPTGRRQRQQAAQLAATPGGVLTWPIKIGGFADRR